MDYINKEIDIMEPECLYAHEYQVPITPKYVTTVQRLIHKAEFYHNIIIEGIVFYDEASYLPEKWDKTTYLLTTDKNQLEKLLLMAIIYQEHDLAHIISYVLEGKINKAKRYRDHLLGGQDEIKKNNKGMSNKKRP